VSDQSVADALRSAARLVLIEAPGGCGKTHQGAEYAAAVAQELGDGRLLILAHTHAACDVFSHRTVNVAGRVEVRTLDSLIAEIATAYGAGIGLDAHPTIWVRRRDDGFEALAKRVSDLIGYYPMIADALARRYPVVVCDEHQDSNAHQHAIVMAIQRAGSKLAAFGDHMQRIYAAKSSAEHAAADRERWEELKRTAERVEALDFPHRWSEGSRELGEWTLEARKLLDGGKPIVLKGRPPKGLRVIVAENVSPRRFGFQSDGDQAVQIRNIVRNSETLLILSPHNETVQSLYALWGRQIPIWEGHTRTSLASLVARLSTARGDAVAVGEAAIEFCQDVFTGFTDSRFAKRFRAQITTGCAKPARGLSVEIQGLAQHILGSPDHTGAAKFLTALHELRKSHAAFNNVHLDYSHEFWDAVRLGSHPDPEQGFAQVLAARARRPHALPGKAISTVHKSKGLEAKNVLVLPCNGDTFGEKHRCLLYVALSRASHELTLVVSRAKPSPLIEV
jgi:DNA helicase-2/ATP-dependent DNA helicase PcrA